MSSRAGDSCGQFSTTSRSISTIQYEHARPVAEVGCEGTMSERVERRWN